MSLYEKDELLAKLKCSDDVLAQLFLNVISLYGVVQSATELCMHLISAWYTALFYLISLFILVKYNYN